LLDIYRRLQDIAHQEYADIVNHAEVIGSRSLGSSKLRIYLIDGTYMDIYLSPLGKYSYHWERRAKTGQIFRHDNAPDYHDLGTFPKHFHDGEEQTVKESHISDRPEEAFREFLEFARGKLKK
jgi:hypothetical protein